MDDKERARVIRDLTRWKAECEQTGGRDFSPEDLSEYVKSMDNMSDIKLEDAWYSNVGEWVLSRRDLDIPDDYEKWLDKQFDNIKSGENIEYGYLASCQIEVSEIEDII